MNVELSVLFNLKKLIKEPQKEIRLWLDCESLHSLCQVIQWSRWHGREFVSGWEQLQVMKKGTCYDMENA